MAVANKCKVCGETNPTKWMGKNKNLCSNCIETCPICGGNGRGRCLFFGSYRCGTCNGHGTVSKIPQSAQKAA